MKREYFKDILDIDGRTIPYQIFNVVGYFEELGYSAEEIENLYRDKFELCQTLNQVIALKQACFLMRHVSHSCGSLSADLFELKTRLINELKDKFNFDFDENLVETVVESRNPNVRLW